MFNEISKILKLIKKGVVIVEDGEPAYVLIPFQDFKNYRIQSRKENLEGLEFFSEEAGFEKKLMQKIDDVSLIQNILDYESAIGAFAASGQTQKNQYDLSLADDQDIKLEDLPF